MLTVWVIGCLARFGFFASRTGWFGARAAISVIVVVLGIWVVGCASSGGYGPPATITIASSPDSGADVTLGGVSVGVTPVTIQGVHEGPTLVVVTRAGYRRAAKTITVPRTGEERFVVDLEPLVGYITIESKPTGSQAFLDGVEYLGDTPIVHNPVVVGKHTYELRKDNYKPVSSTMEIEEDYRYTFAHDLTPKEGRVIVVSRPSAAKIWINDEVQVPSTPAKFELAPGDYAVKVYAKGYIMGEAAFMLGPNEEHTVELALKEGNAPPGMVLVPAGKFIMGVNGASPDERPQREVMVDAYYIDKSEVANEEFKAVFAQHTFPKGKGQNPVTGISYKQAMEYAQAVGKRLPTEEEWEKAARGTDGREYPWGMEFNKDLCNFSGTGADGVVRVGQFRTGASSYGCVDMAGNAYEWTSSWYQAYPGNTDVTKEYGQIFRVLRGGSYKSDRFGVRCARRHYDRMDTARQDYGFRCAKDIAAGP